MKIPANQLSSQLTKSLLPCYLVSGDEPLLVTEALDEIRAAARKHGFGTRELFVQTTGFDWQDLASAGGNLSLFADRQIIELRLPTGKPGVKGSSAIADFAQRRADDILFLVSAPKLDSSAASAKWVKALDQNGGVVQVWPIGTRELPGWIHARMKQSGLRPDRDAVTLLADRVEGNLLAARQEIEKLRLLHPRGAISAQDVETAVADSSRFDVYKLVDAALAGEAARALRILSGVRLEGVDCVIVVWALTRELRTLAGLAESVRNGTELGAAMRQARVWQNRQGLVRACVGRHQPADFYRLLKRARDADAAAKGQKQADPWQLATSIVLDIATAGARAA